MANGRRNGERVLGSGHLIGLFLGVVLLCCVFYTLGYVMGRSQEASTVRAATVEDSGNSTAPLRAAPVNPAPDNAPAGATSNADAQTPASADSAGDKPAAGGEWDFSPKKASDIPATHSDAGRSAASPSATPASPRPEATRVVGPPAGPDENLNTPSPTAPAITATPAMVRTPISNSADTSGPVSLPANYQPPRIPRGSVLLQVAAMTSESDAFAMASVLHKKQFPAFVVTPAGGDRYYRVQVGPYSDAHAAKLVRDMLDQAGFKSIIKH
jgi:DedD protein